MLLRREQGVTDRMPTLPATAREWPRGRGRATKWDAVELSKGRTLQRSIEQRWPSFACTGLEHLATNRRARAG